MNDSIKFVETVNRKHAPLFADLLVLGQQKEFFVKALGLDFELRYGRDVGGIAYMALNEVGALRDLLIQKIGSGPFLEETAARCLFECERLLDFASSIDRQRNIDSLTSEDTLNLFRRYVGHVLVIMPYLSTMILIQNILESKLRGLVPAKLALLGAAYDTDAVIRLATFPARQNFVVQESRALLRIGCFIQRSGLDKIFDGTSVAESIQLMAGRQPALYNTLQEHVSQFCWLTNTYYLGHPFTLENLVARLKELITKDCCERLNHSQAQDATDEEMIVKIHQEWRSAPDLLQVLELTRIYAYVRTYKSDVLFIAHYLVRNLFGSIARRLGVPTADLVYCSSEEIGTFLSGSHVPKDVIAGRKTTFTVDLQNGKVVMLAGSVMPASSTPDRPCEIQGVIASMGRARGVARIVLGPDDFVRVKPNEIIITGMTTPNMMPILEQCAGVVTDEGGILCHAAIISRELGVPCIIDTKIATKTIMEGQMVALDATTRPGTLRIVDDEA